MTVVEVWSSDRLSEVADIWNDAVDDEPLVEDELEACFREGSVVIGAPEGVVVAHVEGSTCHLDLVAVRSNARRNGLGTALVDGALGSLRAERAQWGASVPWYLWPGIETTRTPALGLAESMGFANQAPAIQNMTVETHWQVGRLSTTDLTVTRAYPEIASTTFDLLFDEYPGWIDEFSRGVEQGTVHLVSDGDRPLGLGAHSVNRLGWVGPMATFAHGRGRGVGTAALAAVCSDLASAGYASAEIAWVGPVRFYAKASGAVMGRTFLPLSKQLSG